MKALLQRIFRRRRFQKTTDFPAGWNLTISDLLKELTEGKRKQLGSPETEWARAYERSLIPKAYRFPRKGDLYESKIDQEIEFLTSWTAPFYWKRKVYTIQG